VTKRLIELGVLTGDLPAAVAAWAGASGLQAEVRDGEGKITVGGVLLRLLSPEAGGRPAELLAAGGEGMYELVIEVDDVADTMADLRVKDVLVSGVELDEDGRREIRIDPASSHGVPIRLVEKH
jgi:hypothetical protein